MAKKRISIKDIAKLAGVSSPTVSRALHGDGRMSSATRNRIVQLANEIGYTPSLVARGLVTQRSHCVGLVVPTFADPFHSEVAQGIEEEARRHHYSLFLASTGVDPARELAVVRTMHGRQVDGIIVSASRVGNQYADLLRDTGIPIVLINAHVAGDNFHSIYHDDYKGGCQLVDHLIERGYRRIAYIGNERGGQIDVERRRAWVDTLHAARLPAALAVNGPNGRLQGGSIAAEQLLPQAQGLWGVPPQAIYCYNDTMAIGAMAILRQQGLRIPTDVALTGFDDIDVAAFLEPPLTTLRQPRHKMGVEAMKALLTLINEESNPVPPQATMMQGELIIRSSA